MLLLDIAGLLALEAIQGTDQFTGSSGLGSPS
jgi:hypothetical protein